MNESRIQMIARDLYFSNKITFQQAAALIAAVENYVPSDKDVQKYRERYPQFESSLPLKEGVDSLREYV